MKYLYTSVTIALMVLTAACERRPLDEACPTGLAQIPVVVDWSQSGIFPGSRNDTDYVHRVSIRFFPKDGTTPFDRYLETNIHSGTISVPVGDYSVVAYNEAIDDPYWTGIIRFSQTDSYDLFAATIEPIVPSSFDFYTPQPDEYFTAEPLKLASWSLDTFQVTPDMLSCIPCREDPNAMINALTKVVMRRLTIPVRVVAEVNNLRSAIRIEGAVRGLSHKVYMRSAKTEALSTTHLHTFASPNWNDASQTHGWVERRFLSFGQQPSSANYSLMLGVIFNTGDRYLPTTPMLYDISTQISPPGRDIEIRVGLELPVINDGVHVGNWNDEELIIQ